MGFEGITDGTKWKQNNKKIDCRIYSHSKKNLRQPLPMADAGKQKGVFCYEKNNKTFGTRLYSLF